jgi:hypothetical protein
MIASFLIGPTVVLLNVRSMTGTGAPSPTNDNVGSAAVTVGILTLASPDRSTEKPASNSLIAALAGASDRKTPTAESCNAAAVVVVAGEDMAFKTRSAASSFGQARRTKASGSTRLVGELVSTTAVRARLMARRCSISRAAHYRHNRYRRPPQFES